MLILELAWSVRTGSKETSASAFQLKRPNPSWILKTYVNYAHGSPPPKCHTCLLLNQPSHAETRNKEKNRFLIKHVHCPASRMFSA